MNIQFYKCFRLFFSFLYSIISACFPGTLPVSSPHYHKTIRCCSQSRSFPLARHQKKIRYHSKHKTKHGFYQQRQEKNKKEPNNTSLSGNFLLKIPPSSSFRLLRRARLSLYRVAMATADPKTTQAECTFLVLAWHELALNHVWIKSLSSFFFFFFLS